MDSKTFQIVDFSVAGTMEQHTDFVINVPALNMLKQCCAAVDGLMEAYPYDLRTSMSEIGDDGVDCIIELFDPGNDVTVCSFTVYRLFTKGWK